jgi:hypothetical protein
MQFDLIILRKLLVKKTFFIEVPKEKILNNYKRNFMYKKKIWTEHINIFTKVSLLKLIKN